MLRAQYLENYLSYRLQICHVALYKECLAGAQIFFPESGRGLGHVTLHFWHTIEHISKTTSARQFEFGRRLCIRMKDARPAGLSATGNGRHEVQGSTTVSEGYDQYRPLLLPLLSLGLFSTNAT